MSIIDNWRHHCKMLSKILEDFPEDEMVAYISSDEYKRKMRHELETLVQIKAILIKRGMKVDDHIYQSVIRRTASIETILLEIQTANLKSITLKPLSKNQLIKVENYLAILPTTPYYGDRD